MTKRHEARVEIVLQINGKVRDKLMIPADTDREGMKKIAMELPRTQELTAGKTIVKVICMPKKLANTVVKGSHSGGFVAGKDCILGHRRHAADG